MKYSGSTGAILGPDPSTVAVYDRFAYRKPHAHAAFIERTHWLKNTLQSIRRYSVAIVFQTNQHLSILTKSGFNTIPAMLVLLFQYRLLGIFYQVDQNLLELNPIGIYLRERCTQFLMDDHIVADKFTT